MSTVRKILVAIGVLAVPAAIASAAIAASKTPECCRGENREALTAGEKQIVCPLTGETIDEAECPLCRGEK